LFNREPAEITRDVSPTPKMLRVARYNLSLTTAVAWDRWASRCNPRGLFNDETEHAYRRAVELDPNFAVAYAHLARVLKRSGSIR